MFNYRSFLRIRAAALLGFCLMFSLLGYAKSSPAAIPQDDGSRWPDRQCVVAGFNGWVHDSKGKKAYYTSVSLSPTGYLDTTAAYGYLPPDTLATDYVYLWFHDGAQWWRHILVWRMINIRYFTPAAAAQLDAILAKYPIVPNTAGPTLIYPNGCCDLKILKLYGDDGVLDPTAGGKIQFDYDISGNFDPALDPLELVVAGQTLVGKIWDGKNAEHKIVPPGDYKAALKISKKDNPACKDEKTIPFTVERGGDSCSLKVSFGSSANLANGNLSHSQEVFSLPGSGLSTDLSLYYNSTDPYRGPLGMGWSHSYDTTLTEQDSGDVLIRTGSGGYKLYQSVDGGYLAPRGDYSVLSRNVDNSFTLTRPDGQTSQFNGEGLLVAITDRNGNAMQFDYAAGLLASITDSAGRVTTLAYDANAKLSTITAPDGQLYRFAVVGEQLELVGAAYPGARYWDYTYDANGFLLSKMDPNGNLTTYTYDEQYRVLTSTDPEGRVRSINYPTGEEEVLSSELVEKDGGVWRYTYDTTNGNLLAKSDPQGNTTSYTYDAAGNTLTETGPDGATTSHVYDSVGNLLATTDPAGQTTSYTYNEFGQTTSVTDTAGGVTSYEYDERGNLLTITDPAGAATIYTYDATGRVTSVTDAAGGVTRMTYDAVGNLATITDQAGATTSMVYDAAGRLLAQTDPQGGVSTFTYDAAGNLISTTDPLGGVTSATFDANGNRTSQADANGNTSSYEFNAQGQVVKSIDALGQVTRFSYGGSTGCATCSGGVDKLTALTDANGQATTFEYDSLGRLLREIDPLGNATSYAYDAKGNLIAKTDGNGATIRYSYDVLGRLVKKLYPDQSEENFSYDARGNVLTAVNIDAGYTFAYDTAGRMITVTDQLGRAIRYDYDQAGRKTRMIGPDGKAVNYEYDAAGRLGKIRSAGNFVFGYDQSGRRASLSYPNGVVANYTYDQGDRLTSLTHKTAGGAVLTGNSYTHDQIGNRLTNQTPARTLSYQYDDLYRLTEALSSTPGNSKSATGKGKGKVKGKGIANATQQQKEFFTYDPVGNRLGSENTALYTYNAANQLLTNGGAYSYDKNGNLVEMLTSEGVTLYAWDYENRLKQVTLPGGNTVTFKYDPFGRRIEKTATESGVTSITRYLYDNEDILLETDATGKITNCYILGPGIDEPLAVVQSKNIYYYHADGLGSIVALTDPKGKVVQEYQYDSFGNLHDQMNRVKQPYTYTGREWDRETGLYYYRARYYDAQVGRFISEDPIGYADGANLYQYSRSNPLRYTDPLGLKAGDLYVTRNAAAISAIDETMSISMTLELEYGGYIYEECGKYSYTKAVMGLRNKMNVSSFNMPPHGERATDIYHTHPLIDSGSILISDDDMWVSISKGLPVYMGTRNNLVKVYSRWNGESIVRQGR